MGAVLGDSAVQVSFRASRLTADILQKIVRQVIANHDRYGAGTRVPLRNLIGNKEMINLESKEDLKALRHELRRYKVNYNIVREKGTDNYEVWFSGKDISQVHEGLKKAVKDWDRSSDKKPMKERFAEAREEAAKRNNERKHEAPEKDIGRSEQRETR